MRNKTAPSDVVKKVLTSARYEVLPTAKIEAAIVENVPSAVTADGDREPCQGHWRHARPDREPDPARLHRRPAPGRPDDQRRIRARRDRRPAAGARHRQRLLPGRRRRPAGWRLRRCHRPARGPHRDGPTVRPRRHHRLPREPSVDRGRHHHPVDVGQARARRRTSSATSASTPTRSPPGSSGCANAASRCRCSSACPGRSSAPSCSRWRPRSGSASRCAFSRPTWRTFARIAAPGGYSPEQLPPEVDQVPVRPRARCRRPAPVHVQPSGRDRDLAARPTQLLRPAPSRASDPRETGARCRSGAHASAWRYASAARTWSSSRRYRSARVAQ